MKKNLTPKFHLLTPVMEERVINVAYGNASWVDRWMVAYLRKRNPKVERCLETHSRIVADGRQAWGSRQVSRGFESRLLAIAEAETSRSTARRPAWSWLLWTRQWIQAGAVLSVLTVGLLVWNEAEQDARQRELEIATRQARASIALIGDIVGGTTENVKRDVFIKHAARPLQESILKGTKTIKENI